MMRFMLLVGGFFALSVIDGAMASPNVLFDVAARRAALQTTAFAPVKAWCKAEGLTYKKKLKPITALEPTEGYGTDNSAENFSWAVMVLSGRALAGDSGAEQELKALLLQWADAKAFHKTPVSHDPYYALKRLLLPTIVAVSILDYDLSTKDRKTLIGWLDPLVRRIDKKFGGDVDLNNHRYLADSVLMAWGQYTGDDALYQKGIARYRDALSHMRDDGALPLEVRRGSRAAWYTRQSLANLAVIAEIARQRGEHLYQEKVAEKDYGLMLTYYLNVVQSPLIGQADAAENYKPGPDADFLTQDRGMLDIRPNQRHYMAFGEALLQHLPEGFAKQRLHGLFVREIEKERPLLDDYSGGNGSCFWGSPS